MSFTDKTLTCVDCGASFTFSAEDQEYHSRRGFQNEPKRCPTCRRSRKAERGEYTSSSYQRPQRQLFPAVCSSCGKETEVPFQPRGDRPVYCRECFATQSPSR